MLKVEGLLRVQGSRFGGFGFRVYGFGLTVHMVWNEEFEVVTLLTSHACRRLSKPWSLLVSPLLL